MTVYPWSEPIGKDGQGELVVVEPKIGKDGEPEAEIKVWYDGDIKNIKHDRCQVFTIKLCDWDRRISKLMEAKTR